MNVVNFEDGRCKRIRSYLDSYLNNELMVETNHEVLIHLETCEPCSLSLKDRARLKTQLKRAVMQDYAPPALRERIVNDVRRRRGFNFRTFSLTIAAVAAMLIIVAATFFALNPVKKSAASLQATVERGDITGQILKIGFEDHVYCSIDHQMANRQFTAEQISERLGPEYAGLVALVKDKLPADYTVGIGHRCHYQGREFIHLIMRTQSDVVSLIITRKNGEAFPADQAASVFRASGVPIHEASWYNIQVVGMETRDYFAYVISNKSREGNEQVAANLAPAVSAFLKKMEA